MPAIHVAKSGVWLATGEILECVFFQDLDLLLRLGQQTLAILAQFSPAIVRGQRLLKTQLPRLHVGDYFFQLGQRRFETQGLIGPGGFWHVHNSDLPGTAGTEKSKAQQ
jgi:hypothetical protein